MCLIDVTPAFAVFYEDTKRKTTFIKLNLVWQKDRRQGLFLLVGGFCILLKNHCLPPAEQPSYAVLVAHSAQDLHTVFVSGKIEVLS